MRQCANEASNRLTILREQKSCMVFVLGFERKRGNALKFSYVSPFLINFNSPIQFPSPWPPLRSYVTFSVLHSEIMPVFKNCMFTLENKKKHFLASARWIDRLVGYLIIKYIGTQKPQQLGNCLPRRFRYSFWKPLADLECQARRDGPRRIYSSRSFRTLKKGSTFLFEGLKVINLQLLHYEIFHLCMI